MLDNGLGHLLTDEFRHQIQMVVMADDYGCFFQATGLFNYGVGKSLIYRYVAALPSIMNSGVNVGVVGRVPHVVLEEPEQRIADDVVVFVVGAPGCHNVPQVDLVAREG